MSARRKENATLMRLHALQADARRIRNLCIIAHVDHGKTTLADTLVASNGIISMRSAGEVRYMDSTEEEQRRGITMKSSSIALLYNCSRKLLLQQNRKTVEPLEAYNFDPDDSFTHLINIIDSPGHVDFSCDVATAIRNCDGALVVVDAVEGLCIQTQAVIKQGFQEKLRPILVINKVDRLVTEMEFTPPEAYEAIVKLLEQINTVMGSLYSSRVMADVDAGTSTAALEIDEVDEDRHYFSPVNGNVVFASARDGWAFTVDQFARLLFEEGTLSGLSRRTIRNVLWGDFYFQPKSGKVLRKPQKGAPRRIAERFMFARIWQMYKLIQAKKLPQALSAVFRPRIKKVDNSTGSESKDNNAHLTSEQAQLHAQVMAGTFDKTSPQNVVKRFGQAWLPAADAVLTAVCRQIPSPRVAMHERIDSVFPVLQAGPTGSSKTDTGINSPDFGIPGTQSSNETVSETTSVEERTSVLNDVAALRSAVSQCQAKTSGKALAFISKIFSCPRALLPSTSRFAGSGDDVIFLGFARIFAGVLRPDQILHVLQPRWNPLLPNKNQEQTLPSESIELFLMMGRDLIPIREAPAGNVVAIAGLHKHVHKSATLCTTRNCVSISRLNFQAVPIVQVAVEPEKLDDLAQLEEGLHLLSQADLAVELIRAKTGENILVTLGELHLKHCLNQLKTVYARVPFRCSEPIVRFQETLKPDWIPPMGSGQSQKSLLATVDLTTNSRSSVKTKMDNNNNIGHSDANCNLLYGRTRDGQVRDGSATEKKDFARSMSRGEQLRLNAEAEHVHAASETAQTKLSPVVVPGTAYGITSNKLLKFTVSVVPIPRSLLNFLEENLNVHSGIITVHQLVSWTNEYNSGRLNAADRDNSNKNDCDCAAGTSCETAGINRVDDVTEDAQALVFRRIRDDFFKVLSNMDETNTGNAADGSSPSNTSGKNTQLKSMISCYLPNLLALATQDLGGCNFLCSLLHENNGLITNGVPKSTLLPQTSTIDIACTAKKMTALAQQILNVHGSNILTGFKMSCEHGPLCEEPVHGVCYLLHAIESPKLIRLATLSNKEDYADGKTSLDPGTLSSPTKMMATHIGSIRQATLPASDVRSGSLGGQIIAAMNQCCRRALRSSSPRLVEPMYACNLQCEQSLLGPFYEVLRRRRAQIVEEDLIQGTSTFSIDARLPVIESFGMADELRDMTSGASTSDTQLVLHGWRMIEQDPYFTPATEDELEEYGAWFGTVRDNANHAKVLVDRIRSRKGLPTDAKIVVSAEKQRTISRKK